MGFVTATEILPPDLPSGRAKLVLTGFSGSGKTTVGREVAGRLRLPFIDLDEVVADRAGLSVEQIFESLGEGGFRALERAALTDAAKLSGCVVATGGGAVTDSDRFRQLAAGAVVVVLDCDRAETQRRLLGSHPRPLLEPERARTISSLMREREAAYAAAGPLVSTTGRSVAEVAAEVEARYRAAVPPGPAEVRVTDGPSSYPVLIGPSAVAKLGEAVAREIGEVQRAVVIADALVAGTAGQATATALRAGGLQVVALQVPAGEAAKRIQVVARLWEQLSALGADRHDLIVAVGGGAALDAIGFAAATFARGLPLVNVATTLLAMADAAIGGKVAIDHSGTKNSVGAFHQPRLVVADPEFLATLPVGILRQGLAEVLKAAVLGSPLTLHLIKQSVGASSRQDWSWLVEQAVRIKAAYVAVDPGDLGARQALNLGHTFAHGLESASDYALSHGEAVAVGLLAAAKLGANLGLSPTGLALELQELARGLELPQDPPSGLDPVRVLQAMAGDKKRRAGRAVFVVPRRDGGALLVEGLELAWAVRFLWPDGEPAAGAGS